MKNRYCIVIIPALSLLGGVLLFGQTNMGQRPETVNDSRQHWGPENRGFRLSIRPEKKQVRLGEPISVSVFVSNVTDKALSLPSFDPNFENKVVVTDAQGKKFTFTNRGRMFDGEPGALELTKRTVPARSTIEDILRIDDRFELGATGACFVTVHRIVITNGHWFAADLISNTAKFEIVTGEATKPVQSK